MKEPGEGSGLRVAVVIPAWNEEETIGQVVTTARGSVSVGEVVVVDNGSSDATGSVAARAGARVVEEPVQGKGEAMLRGVQATPAEVILFLDADLRGLRSEHIDALVSEIVSGNADMACGLCDRGSTVNTLFLHVLPVLSGQRALRRELFEALQAREIRGYRVEAALNSLVASRKLRRHLRILEGVDHRTKEEKLGNPVTGLLQKLRMLFIACWSYVTFRFRRRVLEEVLEVLSQR